jgi:hypothetical protein
MDWMTSQSGTCTVASLPSENAENHPVVSMPFAFPMTPLLCGRWPMFLHQKQASDVPKKTGRPASNSEPLTAVANNVGRGGATAAPTVPDGSWPDALGMILAH